MILNFSLSLLVLSMTLLFNRLLGIHLESHIIVSIVIAVIIFLKVFKNYRKFRWFIFLTGINFSLLFLKYIPHEYFMYTRLYHLNLERYFNFFKLEILIEFYYWLRNFLFFNILSDHVIFSVMFLTIVAIIFVLLIDQIQSFRYGKLLMALFIILFISFYTIENVIMYLNIYILGYLFLLMHDTYEQMNRNFVIDVIIFLAIIMMVNFMNFIFPLKTVNKTLDPYIPDVLQTEGGYEKKVNYLFDFDSTIYYPLGDRLGGPVDLEDTIVLKVKSNFERVYLRGRVSNRYDGSRWYNDNNSFYNKINEYDKVSSFRDRIILEIVKVNENSSNVFSPMTLLDTELTEDNLFSNIENIYFYNNDLPSDYKIIGVNKSYSLDNPNRYLRVSETIGAEVEALNESIVKDAQSDQEKIDKLVNYLKENYRYTLRPTYVSPEEDFITAFLIHDQEGYCTYFASSLAILARLNDIPSRYVEGYVTSTEIDDDGFSIVRKENAHAWVEVYLEDEGWQTVEATPNRAVGFRTFERDVETSDETNAGVDQNIPEREFTDIEDNFVGDTNQGSDAFKMIYIIIPFILLLLLFVFIVLRNSQKRSIYERIYLSLLYLREIDQTVNFSLENKDELVLLYTFDNDIIKIINKALYSNEFLVDEEREKLYNFFEEVKVLYIEKFGQFKFYYKQMKGDIDGVSW